MSEWKLPWDGGCRCGRTRLRVSAPPLLASACHCTGCQRMTASAFSLSLAVPSESFAVTAGDPVIGGLHGATRHYFCPHCMSWMFTRPEGMDAFVKLRPSMLDDFQPMTAPGSDTIGNRGIRQAAERSMTKARRELLRVV